MIDMRSIAARLVVSLILIAVLLAVAVDAWHSGGIAAPLLGR